MTRIRMVATDLDGTLLRSDKSVSERTSRAMDRALEAGITVVWATARAQHSVAEFAAQARFRGDVVCANGAVLLDLRDGVRVTRTPAMAPAIARSAIRQFREAVPGTVFALVGPTGFRAEPGYAAASVFADHWRHPHEMETVEELAELDDEIVKVVARHPEMHAGDLYAAVREAGIGDVELTYSLAPYVEMSGAGISKAFGLAALAEERAIDVSEVAAIGDAMNDFAMLSWAGTALAPANAVPEIAAIAHEWLPSNDEDGVAVYLERLLDLQ